MEDYEKLSPLALAFIGDAVHTAFVRKYVLLEENFNKPNNFHNAAKKFCNAKHQKEVLEKITEGLSEEELSVVKRAKNAKSKHTAAHASVEEYTKATAFEALVGYLYLSKNTERLDEILKKSIE